MRRIASLGGFKSRPSYERTWPIHLSTFHDIYFAYRDRCDTLFQCTSPKKLHDLHQTPEKERSNGSTFQEWTDNKSAML